MKFLDGQILDNSHTYSLRIHYEDTDIGGIVYHTKYLNFITLLKKEKFIKAFRKIRTLKGIFFIKGILFFLLLLSKLINKVFIKLF